MLLADVGILHVTVAVGFIPTSSYGSENLNVDGSRTFKIYETVICFRKCVSV